MSFDTYLRREHGQTWRQSAMDADAHLARHAEWRERFPDAASAAPRKDWAGMARTAAYGVLALLATVVLIRVTGAQ